MHKESLVDFSASGQSTPIAERFCNDNHRNEKSIAKDYFTVRDGVEYAGSHLLIDLKEASFLDDIDLIEKTMRDCVDACQATLLHIHLHHFSPSGGVSGVAVLAESHISVHTWPERGYAAFDVFMCGDAEPHRAVSILSQAFLAEKVEVTEQLRGRV